MNKTAMRKPHKLTRRGILKASFAASVAIIATPMVNFGRFQVFANVATEYSTRAIDLVRQSTVVDMLSLLTLDFNKQGRWMADPESFTAADIQPFKDSGINIIHPAIGIGGQTSYTDALQFFGSWNGFIADRDEYFMRIDSAGDIDRVKKSGKLGVILGLQNSDQFRTVNDVDFFRGLGQRVSQLTYNSRNLIGDRKSVV